MPAWGLHRRPGERGRVHGGPDGQTRRDALTWYQSPGLGGLGASVGLWYAEPSRLTGDHVDEDLEVTEDVEPSDEDALLAQGEPDSYDIKKNTGG
jgi:hypothetical protein